MAKQRTEVMTPGEEEIVFYFEVGNAITEWAYIERMLMMALESTLAGAPDINQRAVNVGFMSVESFRAKMDFSDAAIARWLVSNAPHEVRNWKHLAKRIWAASGHRNKLAHWAVGRYPENNPGRRLMLEPPTKKKKPKKTSDPSKPQKKLPPDGAQSLRHISQMRNDFIAVAVSLHNFSERLRGRTEPHARHHEQSEKAPTIAKLRGQMIEELARLLKPSDEKS